MASMVKWTTRKFIIWCISVALILGLVCTGAYMALSANTDEETSYYYQEKRKPSQTDLVPFFIFI